MPALVGQASSANFTAASRPFGRQVPDVNVSAWPETSGQDGQTDAIFF